MAQIVAAEFTRFGKRNEDIVELSALPAIPIVRKHRDAIDFVVVSNSYSGEYADVSGLNNLITTRLSLDNVPSLRVDNTSGSGGSAILTALALVESGIARNVLVIGTEKMTSGNTKRSTRIIASLLNNEERKAGLSLPSLAAFMAQQYLEKFKAKRESLALVAVKNHANGSLNPYAHFQKPTTLEEVMASKVIADPLRIFEYCPVSDGAVAMILSSDETAPSISEDRIRIKSSAMASSSSSISFRKDLTEIECVKQASREAFRRAGVSPSDVDVAELHDMATILEIVESEDAGFFKKGEGWKAIIDGETDIGGKLPINTSGGLNSKGHPIGATGIAQAGEIYLQLTGRAEKRQVKGASIGFALNMSGFGNSATASVFEVV
ncbi:MAG TPA: thiolase family protein [Thermoplasmataceae archaeon]|nr:thiolase family protein [Thermoplasmatales archaeon AK]HLH86290.1 thiolase family protein [Thermoplasmataceae archaeon]